LIDWESTFVRVIGTEPDCLTAGTVSTSRIELREPCNTNQELDVYLERRGYGLCYTRYTVVHQLHILSKGTKSGMERTDLKPRFITSSLLTYATTFSSALSISQFHSEGE
jgi:hypothetical protein